MRWFVLLLITGCGRLGFGEQRIDAGIDAVDPFARCNASLQPDTVALYTFEAGLAVDSTGNHDGSTNGDVTAIPARCGTGAARFGTGWVAIPASTAFDLPEGSAELFVRTATPALGRFQGLLSRDARGTNADGHFTVGLSAEGNVFVRLQRTGDVAAYRCSDPIAADTWVHIATSFGPLGFRLWVDGIEPTTATADFEGLKPCTDPHLFGIAGNGNTFAFGGHLMLAPDNDPAPVPMESFTEGQLDHVHIRSTWHDFGAP